MKLNIDIKENITISVDKNEYKIKLTLAGRYRVNFNLPDFINKVLGFEKVIHVYETDGKCKTRTYLI